MDAGQEQATMTREFSAFFFSSIAAAVEDWTDGCFRRPFPRRDRNMSLRCLIQSHWTSSSELCSQLLPLFRWMDALLSRSSGFPSFILRGSTPHLRCHPVQVVQQACHGESRCESAIGAGKIGHACVMKGSRGRVGGEQRKSARRSRWTDRAA